MNANPPWDHGAPLSVAPGYLRYLDLMIASATDPLRPSIDPTGSFVRDLILDDARGSSIIEPPVIFDRRWYRVGYVAGWIFSLIRRIVGV